jgi:hypothetical protein
VRVYQFRHTGIAGISIAANAFWAKGKIAATRARAGGKPRAGARRRIGRACIGLQDCHIFGATDPT